MCPSKQASRPYYRISLNVRRMGSDGEEHPYTTIFVPPGGEETGTVHCCISVEWPRPPPAVLASVLDAPSRPNLHRSLPVQAMPCIVPSTSLIPSLIPPPISSSSRTVPRPPEQRIRLPSKHAYTPIFFPGPSSGFLALLITTAGSSVDGRLHDSDIPQVFLCPRLHVLLCAQPLSSKRSASLPWELCRLSQGASHAETSFHSHRCRSVRGFIPATSLTVTLPCPSCSAGSALGYHADSPEQNSRTIYAVALD